MLETSNFVHQSAMWSLSHVMSACSLSGRGQGHVSNFYIVDLENFTASRRYTGYIYKSSVVGLFITPETMRATRSRRGWVQTFIIHCLQLNLQLHTIDLVRTCRICSFSTVAWQLARFQLTRRIARSLGDSWASCPIRPCIMRDRCKSGKVCYLLINPFLRSLLLLLLLLFQHWLHGLFTDSSEHILFHF